MRYRSLLAGAVAFALALSLSACGDDDGDDATADTTEAEADDTTADTEATEDTTADTEATEDTEAEAAGDLSAFLVTPEAVGETFADIGYEPNDDPTPCGADLDTDYPADATVGVTLADEALGLGLLQEIRTYADEEASAEVFAAAQDGLSCGAETTIEGVVLGEVTDVSADIGADAFAVEVASEADATEGAVVVVLVGPALSVFQFQGPADVDEGPDPVAIVTENTAALQAELG